MSNKIKKGDHVTFLDWTGTRHTGVIASSVYMQHGKYWIYEIHYHNGHRDCIAQRYASEINPVKSASEHAEYEDALQLIWCDEDGDIPSEIVYFAELLEREGKTIWEIAELCCFAMAAHCGRYDKDEREHIRKWLTLAERMHINGGKSKDMLDHMEKAYRNIMSGSYQCPVCCDIGAVQVTVEFHYTVYEPCPHCYVGESLANFKFANSTFGLNPDKIQF